MVVSEKNERERERGAIEFFPLSIHTYFLNGLLTLKFNIIFRLRSPLFPSLMIE